MIFPLSWLETNFCRLQPTVYSSLCRCVIHSLSHSTGIIKKITLENLQTNTLSSYHKAPLVSLCSTVGAAGTGVLFDPQGLVLAAVPTPGASVPGEKGSGPWVMEPGQGTTGPE